MLMTIKIRMIKKDHNNNILIITITTIIKIVKIDK